MKLNLRKFFYPNTPFSATMEVWAEIDDEERKKPIIYFLVRQVPRWFRVKKMQLRDIKYWFLYRLIKKHKYHLVDTGLKPNYYEIDMRMLHANFNMLKEYVEVELAGMQLWRKEETDNDWISDPVKAGIEHLDWEIELVYEDDSGIDLELVGKPTHQAIAAKEKKALYLWWVNERPARIDPWSVYNLGDNSEKEGSFFKRMTKRTPEQKEKSMEAFEKKQQLEDQYFKEDTEMLIRLIKIRNSLWT